MFICEALIKICVLGFSCGEGTYLKDNWNILDFFIVCSSIINWVIDSFSSITISFLRGFRALRALRPLRMVSKNEGNSFNLS
jgi:voltage-dependent calcium channel L type alpha-1D